MDEDKINFDAVREDDTAEDVAEQTQKALRFVGRVIVGALAAALAAEAFTFRKKK